MRTLIKFTSDTTGRTVIKDAGDIDSIPQGRASDMVLAEGRPRQVNKREFHVLADRDSGVWDDQYSRYVSPGEQFCVVSLIG